MMPHETQALIAKILFFFFATALLCMGHAKAIEANLSCHQTHINFVIHK